MNIDPTFQFSSLEFASVEEACADLQWRIEVFGEFAQEWSVTLAVKQPQNRPATFEDVRGLLLSKGHPPPVASLVRAFAALVRTDDTNKHRATRVTLAACKCAYRYADRAMCATSVEVAWQELAQARYWEGIARALFLVNTDKGLAGALKALHAPKARYLNRKKLEADATELRNAGKSKGSTSRILASRTGAKYTQSTFEIYVKALPRKSPANGK